MSIVALVVGKAEPQVRIDRVESAVLQRIGAKLVGKADPAAFLAQVEQNAASGRRRSAAALPSVAGRSRTSAIRTRRRSGIRYAAGRAAACRRTLRPAARHDPARRPNRERRRSACRACPSSGRRARASKRHVRAQRIARQLDRAAPRPQPRPSTIHSAGSKPGRAGQRQGAACRSAGSCEVQRAAAVRLALGRSPAPDRPASAQRRVQPRLAPDQHRLVQDRPLRARSPETRPRLAARSAGAAPWLRDRASSSSFGVAVSIERNVSGFGAFDADGAAGAQRGNRPFDRARAAQTASSQISGTWSDGRSQLRQGSRTRCETTRSGASGETHIWSSRRPRSFFVQSGER